MIQILTDSTASLPASLVEALNIDVISLHILYDGQEFIEADMDLDEFYKDIANMKDNPPKSSQPNAQRMEEYFEAAAQMENSVVGVFMSSALSGTFEGVVRAAQAVEQRYPNFEYALVDSLSTGCDEGLVVLSAVAAREAGATCHQCAQAAADAVSCTRFLFAPESLSFLRAGGRIGSGVALLGNALKITPIFTVKDGMTDTFAKVRTQKKAAARMLEIMLDDLKKNELNDVVVHYIGDKKDAVEWAEKHVAPAVGHTVPVLPVSPVVGAHVGPAFGVVYQCKEPLKGKTQHRKPEIVHSSRLNIGAALAKLPFVSRFLNH